METYKEKDRFIGNPFVMNGEDRCPKCGSPLIKCIDRKKEMDSLWMCVLCTWVFQAVYEKKEVIGNER